MEKIEMNKEDTEKTDEDTNDDAYKTVNLIRA